MKELAKEQGLHIILSLSMKKHKTRTVQSVKEHEILQSRLSREFAKQRAQGRGCLWQGQFSKHC